MFHSHISCNLSSKVTLKSMWSQARWRKWFYCWRRIISWQIMIMMADADLIETCQYHWLLTIIIDTTISLALQLSSHNTNQEFQRENQTQMRTKFSEKLFKLPNPYQMFRHLSKDSETFCLSLFFGLNCQHFNRNEIINPRY